MPTRRIVTHPDPVLRRKARKVTEFTPELQALIDDMAGRACQTVCGSQS